MYRDESELRTTAGCSARASKLSNLAPRLSPARRTVAGGCPDMCELVWGEPGTFVKKGVFGENTPFILNRLTIVLNRTCQIGGVGEQQHGGAEDGEKQGS